MTPDEMQGPSLQGQPSEEEMRAALEEELKRVRVEQVVTEATVSILNVAVLRAGIVPGSEGDADPVQVRMGIEAVRALLPLVEEAVGTEQAKPIRDALSQLQMAYVRSQDEAAGAQGAAPSQQGAPGSAAPGDGGSARDARPQADGAPAGDEPADGASEPGPAQSSGRLWVPGQ